MSKYFLQSTLIHFLAIFVFWLSTKIFFPNIFDGNQENVIPIEVSARIDVIGLPDLTLNQLKNLKNIPKDVNQNLNNEREKTSINSELEKSKMTDVNEEKLEKDKNEEVEKNEKSINENELETVAEQKKTKNSNKQLKNEHKQKISDALSGLILAGNQLSKGSSAIGVAHSQSDPILSNYLQDILVEVKREWKLPPQLFKENLKCRIQVFLNERGEILDLKIQQNSGNNIFEEKAIEAIRLAAPFSPPPKEYIEKISQGLITLGFPL